jgi:hypothetical protein
MSGIRMPTQTQNGRLLLSSTEQEQLKKIIMIAAGPRESTNPWCRAGTDIKPFSLDGPRVRADIRRGLQVHFDRLERAKRARLANIRFSSGGIGVLNVEITYDDLIANSREVLTITATTGGA